MDAADAMQRWRGAFLPVLTIFDDNRGLDLAATRRNVRHVIQCGAKVGNTVFLAVGAGGDFPMLATDERKRVAEAIVAEANARVPVIVGCQHTSTAAAIELARHAEEIGAEGVQVSPPFYYRPSDEDVYEFLKAISDSISIGMMVYHTWWLGFEMSMPLLERLASLEQVVSLKWSSPGIRTLVAGYRHFASRLAIVDNTGLRVYPHILGANGYITHLASFWPQVEWETWDRLDRGEYREVQKMMDEHYVPWIEFRGKMGRVTGGEGNVVKAAMQLCGLDGGPVRPPTRPMTADQREELRQVLIQIGAPVKS